MWVLLLQHWDHTSVLCAFCFTVPNAFEMPVLLLLYRRSGIFNHFAFFCGQSISVLPLPIKVGNDRREY